MKSTEYPALVDSANRLRSRGRRLLAKLLKPATRADDSAWEYVDAQLDQVTQQTHALEALDSTGPVGRMMRRLRREIADERA